MKVWVTRARTEADDEYLFAFEEKPDYEKVATMIWAYEGKEEDLSFYIDTVSIISEFVDIE